MSEPSDESRPVETGASDVLAEDEIVQVSPGVVELVESQEMTSTSTFLPEVPDWDEAGGSEEPTA